jgi:hypothetical protein
MKLLTTANTKIAKGKKYGFMTYGIHLAPSNLSGVNTCSHASVGCAAACLNTAGMGVFSNVQKSRIDKTHFFTKNRELFLSQLHKEITAAIRKAKRDGLVPCFRLNLTSDLPWENVKFQGKNMMEHFPDVQFYDYTKNPSRMIASLTGKFPKNYHLTFSRSESNQTQVEIVSAIKGNVAVVFHNTLPKRYLGKRVVDGDKSDLRFKDGKGVIVGLVAKGKGKRDATGFILSPSI